MNYWTSMNPSNHITIRFALILIGVLATCVCDLHARNNWERMFTGPPTRRIDALGTTAAGTVLAPAEGRLFRSDDGGRSWSVSDSGLRPDVREIIGHPSGTVVAIAQPGGNLGYLFVSTDDGRTWRASTVESSEQNNFTALAISPEGDLYAGNSQHYVSNSIGLFRSTDGGRSWKPNGLAEHYSVLSVLYDTGGVIVVVQNDYYNNRFHLSRSTDTGATWSTTSENDLISFGSFQQMLRDSSGRYLMKMSRGIYISTDRGAGWSRPDQASPSMSELVVLLNGDLLGSTVGGFLRSGDGGRTWDTVAAAPAEISMTTLLPMSDGETLISGSTAGIYRSSDRGRTWDTSSTGMPTRFGFSYSFGSNRAIVETWRAVYHSEHLVAWMRAPFAGRVLVDERDAYVIGTYDSLYRSVDGGGTWISVGRNPDGNNRLVTNGTGAIFAVDNNGGLRRSIDGGINWVRYHFGASHGGAADLKFRGRTGVHATGGTGLASTTDNGDTWHYAKHDYTSSIAAVAPDLTSYALGEWYRSTGTFNGLFKLVYGDTIWQPVTAAQLPGTGDSATALIATEDGALFAIWNGRAYRSTRVGW